MGDDWLNEFIFSRTLSPINSFCERMATNDLERLRKVKLDSKRELGNESLLLSLTKPNFFFSWKFPTDEDGSWNCTQRAFSTRCSASFKLLWSIRWKIQRRSGEKAAKVVWKAAILLAFQREVPHFTHIFCIFYANITQGMLLKPPATPLSPPDMDFLNG